MKAIPVELPVKPANGGWKDLNKTLPEVGKQVLVFNKIMKIYNLCELVEWDNKRQWYDYECTQDFNMYDYWMELPDKP